MIIISTKIHIAEWKTECEALKEDYRRTSLIPAYYIDYKITLSYTTIIIKVLGQ